MSRDVRDALAVRGLNLNLDKRVVQTNCSEAPVLPIEIDGCQIPMVRADEGFKVLGSLFTLRGRCSAEIKARVSAAWGRFYSSWPLLGKRDGNLHQRLQLLDICVTQTAF